jgi:hypothetical protein
VNSKKEILMTLTARVRSLFYWLMALNMVFIAITQWFSHSATGFSVTGICLSLFAACCSVVEAMRTRLHPRPFTLSLAKLLIIVVVMVVVSIGSGTTMAMAVLTHFDTLSAVGKICSLSLILLSLLWLGAGSWLAFRYFCLWRKKRGRAALFGGSAQTTDKFEHE